MANPYNRLHPPRLHNPRTCRPFLNTSRSILLPPTVRASPFSGLLARGLHTEGWWRQGFPDAATMANGGFAGKGRIWAWAQACEEFTQRPPTSGCGFETQLEKAWASERAPRPGGLAGPFRKAASGKGGKAWGAGAKEETGSKSGPFDQEGFKWSQWRQRIHGDRCERRGGGRFRPGRPIHHHARKPDDCGHRHRFKTGLLYFLLNDVPRCAPAYRPPFLISHLNILPRTSASVLHSAPPPPCRPSNLYHPSTLRTSLLLNSAPLAPPPSATSLHIRLFSTSFKPQHPPPTQILEAGFPIFLPLLAVLKSSAALSTLTFISRIALTLLPLSARAKLIHVISTQYLLDPQNAKPWVKRIVEASGRTVSPTSAAGHFNARFILPLLLFLPFAFLGAVVVASFERTPVTGRLRIIMLSPTEEADLVASILASGTLPSFPDAPIQRDWVTILRNVLELSDEGRSSTTGRRVLLGGEVLDERDWRVRWTEAVLRALEAGVPVLGQEEGDGVAGVLQPPPTKFPLRARPTEMSAKDLGWEGATLLGKHLEGHAQGKLVAEYDLLVLERDEANAFSFGFGPDELDAGDDSRGRRGVIVVYTGFIDEILGKSPGTTPPPLDPRPAQGTTFFSGLFYSRRAPAELPNAVPSVLPTATQTKSLAVLLSHELSHLILSHTLESYANTSLLVPHISKLFSDVARTLLYPITAMLGPFFNDAIARSMNVGAMGGFGTLGELCNSCESRKLEEEADVVGLRLLAHSGIDPRHALDFWQERLATPPSSNDSVVSTSSPHLRLHSSAASPQTGSEDGAKDSACSFLRTHPVDADRVKRIREELERWMVYRGGAVA